MGDVGDYWRDHREHKKQQRRQMVECQGSCAGHWSRPNPNPPKVFPGQKCHRCGWQAPKAERRS